MDEFEDVPSPFAKTTTRARNTSSTRSNMFARPMGAAPSEAPTVVARPAGATRRAPVAREEQPDFLLPKRQVVTAPSVDYLDDEEEEETEEEELEEPVVERRPARPRSAPRAKAKSATQLLPRVGWILAGCLLLRLVFMERGVLQYWRTGDAIAAQETELVRVKKENADLRTEIRRIEVDKGHQRLLAKEHLGVIAADEFLILFAGEAQESPDGADRPL